ncbi:hypothetical protein F3Y22_tig00110429pilonHSYRG01478 [Hibiscus syriacus]|uniref:Uncharacterized protein n=1 Tax=Hibiscus syriacus TaxID=106335 RepID=A0A6A3ANA6_HIBSY|nr:hypothetical protein F3Y22_tig00110429pilonHSYRG01478 [Hibiscus syriacus]
MHDPIGIPACFSSSDHPDEPTSVPFTSWSIRFGSRTGWLRALQVQSRAETLEKTRLKAFRHRRYNCRCGLRPQGSQVRRIDLAAIGLLPRHCLRRRGHFTLGRSKKNAYRKTGCRPSLIEPILISRREHIFGKRKFTTRVMFNDKETFHNVSVECNSDGIDPVLEIRVNRKLAVEVKHLQWKFRGNESLNVGKMDCKFSGMFMIGSLVRVRDMAFSYLARFHRHHCRIRNSTLHQ